MTSPVPDGAPPWYRYAAKAVAAFTALAGVFLSDVLISLADGSAGGSQIVATEWLRISIDTVAAIGGTLAVYGVTNTYGTARRPSGPARPDITGVQQVSPDRPDIDTLRSRSQRGSDW